MSNLRSDARDYCKPLPAGDVNRSYIERLCCQVDTLEEAWQAAERRAKYFQKITEAFNWLCEMRCTVQRNSVLCRPDWSVLDVDGKEIGSGWSPVDEIKQARQRILNFGEDD